MPATGTMLHPRREARMTVTPPPQPRSSRARVLVVDDNELNRRAAAGQLERQGLLAVPVASGPEALDRLAAEPFDLVLIDAFMPGMGGAAVAREIRRREAAGGVGLIPLVAVTASVLPEDRDGALGAGMNALLTKPIDPGELADVLRRHLPGTRRTTTIPARLGRSG
jgi:CheY-like chemotaxis protein